MAVKNHALDDKITAAAQAEFLEKGFRGASLQQIARRAGTTTGALYTRYSGKDDLFRSLVQDLLEEIQAHLAPIARRYAQVQGSGDPLQMLEAIREEEQIYLRLLAQRSQDCVLLFCRSGGSTLEKGMEEMMERKARETVAYLKQISTSDMDLDGIGTLISGQYVFFRKILDQGYSPEKAVACMKTVECYMDAGWKALFEAIL